jgi:hypothetical protein
VATTKAPNDSKDEQAQNAVTTSEVPDHGIAAQIACDHQSNDQRCQSPVEEASWPIPNTYLNHEKTFNARRFVSKDLKIMRNCNAVQRHWEYL